MIWFAGNLYNICCNKAKENKTKTNTELSGVVSFKQLRALSDIVSHQFYSKHTNN